MLPLPQLPLSLLPRLLLLPHLLPPHTPPLPPPRHSLRSHTGTFITQCEQILTAQMLHEFHLLTCILTFPPQSLTGWVLGFSIDAAPSARSLLVVVPPAVQLSVVPPSLSPTAPSARSPLVVDPLAVPSAAALEFLHPEPSPTGKIT